MKVSPIKGKISLDLMDKTTEDDIPEFPFLPYHKNKNFQPLGAFFILAVQVQQRIALDNFPLQKHFFGLVFL